MSLPQYYDWDDSLLAYERVYGDPGSTMPRSLSDYLAEATASRQEIGRMENVIYNLCQEAYKKGAMDASALIGV